MPRAEDPSWRGLQRLLNTRDLHLQKLHLGDLREDTSASEDHLMLASLRLPPALKRSLRLVSLHTDPTPWLSDPGALPANLVQLDLEQAPTFNPVHLLARLQAASPLDLPNLRILRYKFKLVYGSWCTPGRSAKEALLWRFDEDFQAYAFDAASIRAQLLSTVRASRRIHLLPESAWFRGVYYGSFKVCGVEKVVTS